ncbi:MAG: TatD family hydrolase [Clostridia bacterium]|nr:TatD family hydrolase [Clostridia bacterium]
MIFDSHAHYNDDAFAADADEILASMPENNVGRIMNACAALGEMDRILELCRKFPFVYGSVGIHPEYAEKPGSSAEAAIKSFAADEKILAVGEIGLDYHYDEVPRDIQKECFDFQLSLAGELNLPVIIHDREAHKDCLDIASAHREVTGVFHCFSGSREMAREVLGLGYYIAFGGSLTFKNNVKTVEAAKYVPLDRIVVETDCPYLAPVPMRGKRNSSHYIRYVIDKLAEIKNTDRETIENITFENAERLFRIGGKI